MNRMADLITFFKLLHCIPRKLAKSKKYGKTLSVMKYFRPQFYFEDESAIFVSFTLVWYLMGTHIS